MKVLVTGASRGIGRAVAQRLHAGGARLALSARAEPHLLAVLRETPGSVGLAAELTEPAELAGLVDRAAQALSGLDGFVHCAGVVHYADALSATRAELEQQLQVNCVAPFLLTQHAARHMRAAGGGAIVHVASTLGLRPAVGTAAYAASKAALISLTRSFALELGADRIRVNALAPGVIDTDMVRVLRPRAEDQAQLSAAEQAEQVEQQLSALARLHPLGRLGTAAEVAEAVAYLLAAEFVTGSVLTIDGGLLAG